MFSYRHAFHAGNHADVLKHSVLIHILEYMQQKETGITFIDTHAGAGSYLLSEGINKKAQRNLEAKNGIRRLWQANLNTMNDALIHAYLSLIAELNPDSQLNVYPGSPQIIAQRLRKQDRAVFFELHPTDFNRLNTHQENWRKRNIQSLRSDGWQSLKALLPPVSRRALVLMDPSYENKQDYRDVIKSLREALARFVQGTYIVWYPKLARVELERMLKQLPGLSTQDFLQVELQVAESNKENANKLLGSGLWIINPPWTLVNGLKKTLPFLLKKLGLNLDGKNSASAVLRYTEGDKIQQQRYSSN